jgi:hypothetical protein
MFFPFLNMICDQNKAVALFQHYYFIIHAIFSFALNTLISNRLCISFLTGRYICFVELCNRLLIFDINYLN